MSTHNTLQELPFYDASYGAFHRHDELECPLTSHKLVDIDEVGQVRGYLRVCAGCGWGEYTPEPRDVATYQPDWEWLTHLSTVLTEDGNHINLNFTPGGDRTLNLPAGIGDQEDITVFCEPNQCFAQSLQTQNIPQGTHVQAFRTVFDNWTETHRQELLDEYLAMLRTLENCDGYISNTLNFQFEYHPEQPTDKCMERTHTCIKSIAHDETYEELRLIRRVLTVIKLDKNFRPQDVNPDIYGVGMIVIHFTFHSNFLCVLFIPVILTRQSVMDMPWYSTCERRRPAELWRHLDESHRGIIPQPKPRSKSLPPISLAWEWKLKIAEPSY
ncbi:hypothetical protein QCA50_020565 [Cerrena zonata]|uniref:Uncharacterized protein n=1 Tax=Cerrena zonata TaxID=2478898 RepID=A0AAW0F9C4_9APHY